MTVLLFTSPAAAFAQATLTCTGARPSGYLFNPNATGGVCYGSNMTNLQDIFTGLVCNFEGLINSIMTYVYCGIQFSMMQPLSIGVIIFIMVTGIQMITGHMQVRMGEIIIRMFKVSMIWLFATNASFGIDLAYNFFMGTANYFINLVFSASVLSLPPITATQYCSLPNMGSLYSGGQAFVYIDYMLCSIVTGPFTAQGAVLAGFFSIMAWMIPPIFMMFTYFFIQSLKILIRAVFIYLLAISCIAFLVTMSPIFASFALFNATRHFFEDWLRFLISFTLQIILVFIGVAMWIMVIFQLTGFLNSLSTMIRPVQETAQAQEALVPLNTWGICTYQLTSMCPDGTQPTSGVCSSGYPAMPYLQCQDQCLNPPACTQWSPPPIKPTQLIEQQDFMYLLIVNLTMLCTVCYVFEALMRALPSLARQLSGAPHAPQLGGGRGTAMAAAVNFGETLALESTGGQAKQFTNMFQDMLGNRSAPQAPPGNTAPKPGNPPPKPGN